MIVRHALLACLRNALIQKRVSFGDSAFLQGTLIGDYKRAYPDSQTSNCDVCATQRLHIQSNLAASRRVSQMRAVVRVSCPSGIKIQGLKLVLQS